MPIATKKHLAHKKKPYWEDFERGYEKTHSSEIIEQSLTRLMKKRVFISLAQKDYKSGPTVLVGVNQGQILIDKPIDWPDNGPRIRIIFRDKRNLLNQCFVSLISSTRDTIYAHRPTELFRLQRRNNHRVVTPYGSRVSFNYHGLLSRKYIIKDISAGGMLFCTGRQLRLTGAKLTDISVNIPLVGADSESERVKDFLANIRAGEVVRTCRDRYSDLFCYGVSFLPKPTEEDTLAKYVRYRELEMLRAGVQA